MSEREIPQTKCGDVQFTGTDVEWWQLVAKNKNFEIAKLECALEDRNKTIEALRKENEELKKPITDTSNKLGYVSELESLLIQLKDELNEVQAEIKAVNDDMLKANRLDYHEDERWPVALIAMACALFVTGIAVVIVLGLTYGHWREIVGL